MLLSSQRCQEGIPPQSLLDINVKQKSLQRLMERGEPWQALTLIRVRSVGVLQVLEEKNINLSLKNLTFVFR